MHFWQHMVFENFLQEFLSWRGWNCVGGNKIALFLKIKMMSSVYCVSAYAN